MRPPKVSVVIPTYQRAAVLVSTLDSLRRQTLTDFELLVCDDGSSDGTADAVGGIRDSRVRYLRREHLGMPRIVNEGLREARGEYVMICHDHDVYEPMLLEALSRLLDRYPTAAFAHCGLVALDENGRESAEFVYDYQELTPGMEFLVNELLPGPHCVLSSLNMVRASSLDSTGMNPRYREAADLELWMRLSSAGDVAYTRARLIKMLPRDEKSVVFGRHLYVLGLTLDAKRAYLRWVPSETRRNAIERDWRASATRAALGDYILSLARGVRVDSRAVEDFLAEYGNPSGRRILRLLAALPARMVSATARRARAARRVIRRARRRTDGERARLATRERERSPPRLRHDPPRA
jgi:glycosyltransferase involved in cell wall biosynthesis